MGTSSKGYSTTRLSLTYRLWRWFVTKLIKPNVVGHSNPLPPNVFYVLKVRSLTDLVLCELITAQRGDPNPLSPHETTGENRRFFCLKRPQGLRRRVLLYRFSKRWLRLAEESQLVTHSSVSLVPISVFWGRGASPVGLDYSSAIFREMGTKLAPAKNPVPAVQSI